MAEHLRKCPEDQRYSLQKTCPACTEETFLPLPPKFSLQDKYASLRREAKKPEFHKMGLY